MSDNRAVAGILMKEGWETISKKRHGVHGSAENSFEMIGDLWGIYLRHARKIRGHDRVLPEDVAEMMSMLKKVRKMYGDKLNVDNDVDDLGYSALAGMLRLPDITKDKEGQIDTEIDKLDPLQNKEEEDHEHQWVYTHENGEEQKCVVEGCKSTRYHPRKRAKKTDAAV